MGTIVCMAMQRPSCPVQGRAMHSSCMPCLQCAHAVAHPCALHRVSPRTGVHSLEEWEKLQLRLHKAERALEQVGRAATEVHHSSFSRQVLHGARGWNHPCTFGRPRQQSATSPQLRMPLLVLVMFLDATRCWCPCVSITDRPCQLSHTLPHCHMDCKLKKTETTRSATHPRSV